MSAAALRANADTTPQPDPTETKSLRGSWTSTFNSDWRDVRGAIREWVERQDQLTLKEGARTIGGPTDDAARLLAFREFLRRTLDEEVLEPTSPREVRRGTHRTASWIRRAYEAGLRRADRALRTADIDPPETDPAAAITRERHQRELRRGYARTYQDVEDIVRAVEKDEKEHLSDLLENSEGSPTPREAADTLTARADAVGQTRSAVLATSIPVILVNRAALTRYETAGVEEVGAKIETSVTGPNQGLPDGVSPADVESADESRGQWTAVMDAATCAQCATLHGQTFRISDIRAGRAPMPVVDTHGGCRCLYLPA
jgi:hypothetical protein